MSSTNPNNPNDHHDDNNEKRQGKLLSRSKSLLFTLKRTLSLSPTKRNRSKSHSSHTKSLSLNKKSLKSLFIKSSPAPNPHYLPQPVDENRESGQMSSQETLGSSQETQSPSYYRPPSPPQTETRRKRMHSSPNIKSRKGQKHKVPQPPQYPVPLSTIEEQPGLELEPEVKKGRILGENMRAAEGEGREMGGDESVGRRNFIGKSEGAD